MFNLVFCLISQVNIGTNLPHDNLNTNFVNTSYHEHLLCELVHSHLVTDFCIVGPAGCGKSALIKKFAELMNYEIEPIVLYQVKILKTHIYYYFF